MHDLSGVPTMYFALLQADTAGRDLSSLRFRISGGTSVPGEVISSFVETLGECVVLEGYGLSESASNLDRQAGLGGGGAGRRRGRRAASSRGGVRRRDRYPRPPHHEGLLQEVRGHGGGVPERLVPHRRPARVRWWRRCLTCTPRRQGRRTRTSRSSSPQSPNTLLGPYEDVRIPGIVADRPGGRAGCRHRSADELPRVGGQAMAGHRRCSSRATSSTPAPRRA